jgi:hypothetical protein
MITRRTGGGGGATVAVGSAALAVALPFPSESLEATVALTGVSGTELFDVTASAGIGVAISAGASCTGGALLATTVAAYAALAAVEVIAGLVPAARAPGACGVVEAGFATTTPTPGTTTGGRPTLTPSGGREAIAGGGATIRAP